MWEGEGRLGPKQKRLVLGPFWRTRWLWSGAWSVLFGVDIGSSDQGEGRSSKRTEAQRDRIGSLGEPKKRRGA